MILQRLKRVKDDNSGVAMIVALIVGVVVMVFCLSLLFVSYTFYAQMVKNTTNEQCKMFAQSFEEVLENEIQNPDSEICTYLSEQIKDGNWVATVANQGESNPSNAVTELVVNMDNTNDMSDYHIIVTFSFQVNQAPDEEEEGNEEDDQDDDLSEGEVSQTPEVGEETGSPQITPVVGGNYAIKAKIQCYRGELEDSDTPVFLETEYPTITLNE